ncbi:ATP-dependent helicase Lhr and Lhr-like helicase [Roseateles sp. YR242]|uniref:ligase-associated DNA damage response DEXH box helicase n=1 Tax=Roseateles sp. YR242 TaxID=1855305 RepID=UPI0008BF8EFA|nr:ligase-associated DNA damage response DEXH box helicase [Roseateles sp. YR242]SEL66441.1 ATP-dependent helicase Lhr and Lhr-like helicase [Roseateles sp. YR242]
MAVDPERWLQQRGWAAFDFQRRVWAAMAEGRSGMLHASTGSGKTLAVWLGALAGLPPGAVEGRAGHAPPLTVVWITPMRALAADTFRALVEPLRDLHPTWTIGLRSGDTQASERAAQDRRLPTVLVTTPESLSLLMSRADAPDRLGQVRLAVVDEWHELMGNKRGVQTQLGLARLRRFNPALMCWGLSATLGNLEEALRTLLGPDAADNAQRDGQTDAKTDGQTDGYPDAQSAAQTKARLPPVLIEGATDKTLVIDTLLPATAERFAWAGHMGLRMLPQVVAAIEESASCLVFTNMRSQAERWYRALLEARPDWAGILALHHGSLDREVREWVEVGLKEGRIKAAVCTSSLDLGVDFLPVDRVLQIGSAKGVARLVQRAGRSGHAPGRPSRITLVPTNSLELVEASAVRSAVRAGQVEARRSPKEPLDVLVQHLVTIALGGGFTPKALLAEVRGTVAYEHLTADSWQWCLDFVRQGGPSLAAYPDYHRVVPDEQGVWRVPDARLARRHRVNIGTIVSDAAVTVQYLGGARLGTVEEGFVARLKPGDAFMFSGRLLELVRVEQMTALVRRATAGRAALPRWNGGRMPLSSTLADAVLRELDAANQGHFDSPEMQCVKPLIDIQQRWSGVPTPSVLLAETFKSREGWHLFLYPFAGRQVHLGLAGLLAWRAAQPETGTFSIAMNDYGIELLSAKAIDWNERLPGLLTLPPMPVLLAEVLGSLNATELARRRFREIARVAGLIFQSHPGERRSNRQLQASASLFFEVFQQYDPENRLLKQAERELLTQELDVRLLAEVLARMQGQTLRIHALRKPTPLGFPLMVERFREKLTNESLADRIARMVSVLERSAGGDAVGTAHEPANRVFARPDSPGMAVGDSLALETRGDTSGDRTSARAPARGDDKTTGARPTARDRARERARDRAHVRATRRRA